MPKRSSRKETADPNKSAFKVLQHTINSSEASQKNPAAVALGRLGGLRGGRARAESLSQARRQQIARKAAQARWKAKRQ